MSKVNQRQIKVLRTLRLISPPSDRARVYGEIAKKKRDYADSLFWNSRSGENDLLIKIEFINDGQKLVLARHCQAAMFKKPAYNRADKYENFKLYELSEFESSAFTKANQRDDSFLDEVFGKTFLSLTIWNKDKTGCYILG